MKLGDVCQIKYGKDHKALLDGTIPVYGSGGIMRYCDKYIHNKQSVLIPRKGTLSNIFYVNQPFWTVDTLFWTDINEEIVLPKYLYYLLLTKNLSSLNVGTAVPSLTADILNDIQITLPSLSIQENIVKVLSSFDDKIELNKQLNDYLEKLGQMIFDDYLDSCEKKATLGNILDFGNGFAFKSGTYDDCGIYKILTIKNVQNGIVDCSFSNRVNSYPAKMKKYCRLNIGDVVLSLTGNVGRIGIVAERNCLLNQRVAVLQPKNKTFLPGLYFLFRKGSFQDTLIGIAKGTAQANLSPIETLQLTVPYDETSFVTTCSKLNYIFDLILKNRIEEIALNKLRDLLLPKLISGEFNLSKNIDN